MGLISDSDESSDDDLSNDTPHSDSELQPNDPPSESSEMSDTDAPNLYGPADSGVQGCNDKDKEGWETLIPN